MLDLSKTNLPIKHWSEDIPEIVHYEMYQWGNMKYIEWYNGLSKEFITGKIEMYGVYVCLVGPNGCISFNMPTEWVTNHKDMMALIDDLKHIDEFLSIISDQYSK